MKEDRNSSYLRTFETGLPVDFLIYEDEPNIIQIKHNDNWIPVGICSDPKIPVCTLNEQEISQIKEFVKINYEILVNLGEIGIIEFGRKMKKI